MREIIEDLSNQIKNIVYNVIEQENNFYFYTIKRKTKDGEIVKEGKKYNDLAKCKKARDKAVSDILEDVVDIGITKNANSGLYSFRATKLINGKKKEITGKNIKFLKDARSQRQQAIDELEEKSNDKSEITEKAKMDSVELMNEYFDYFTDAFSFSTKRLYGYNIKSFNEYLNSKSINDVDVNDIANYLLELKSDGHKDTTVKNTKSKLSNIFDYAYERGYIKSNPVKQVITVKKKSKDKRIKENKIEKSKEEAIYTKEQFKEICDIIEKEDEDYLPFLYLAYYAGLRVGESSGLLYDNVLFTKRVIKIEHQLQRQNGMYCLIPPKSVASVREIPISDELYTFLLDLKDKQEKDKAEKGIAYKTEKIVIKTDIKEVVKEDLNFVCKRNTGAIMKANATQLIKWYLLKYDEEKYKDFKLHDLRKTFASNIKNDVSSISLIRVMGHKSIKITNDTYLKETEEDVDSIKNAIKNL